MKIIFLGIILGLPVLFFCGSCSSIRTGSWSFTHKNGNVTSGVWEYQGDEAISDPWDERLEHATGEMIAWWQHNEAKAKYYQASYRDGKPDGLWRVWHRNGKKKCVGHLEQGKRIGVWTWWNKQGHKESEEEFDGDMHTTIVYWPNGQKKSQTSSRGEKAHGMWTFWDENGNVLKKEVYKNGVRLKTP